MMQNYLYYRYKYIRILLKNLKKKRKEITDNMLLDEYNE